MLTASHKHQTTVHFVKWRLTGHWLRKNLTPTPQTTYFRPGSDAEFLALRREAAGLQTPEGIASNNKEVWT